MKEYFHAWNMVFSGLPKPFWKIYGGFSNLRYAWNEAPLNKFKELKISNEYISKFLELKQNFDPLKDINNIEKQGIKVVTIQDEAYPKDLRMLNNHLPPIVLYIKGNYSFNNQLLISIVGTRRMTGYGESITKKIVKELKGYNVCIVSGMADGIDSVAHKAALENGIPTIAVLGHGLNHIPYYKLEFSEQIMKNGLVISEYPPCLQAQKYNFPLRNRIISGLSKALIVVEAGEKSGALITAQYALDQGREVLAVPGSLYNEKSIGTNNLFKEPAASIYTEVKDLFEAIKRPYFHREHSKIYSASQKTIIDELKKSPCNTEDLINYLKFQAKELNMLLTELELEGAIKKDMDGKYYLE